MVYLCVFSRRNKRWFIHARKLSTNSHRGTQSCVISDFGVFYNMINRSQLNFANVTTVTLSWRVQSFAVISRIYFEPEHWKFWSNFEFDWNTVSGMGAWLWCVQTIQIMMTSSNGNIFRVTGPLCGVFTGPGEFPAQRPVTRSFDVFFHLRLNKRSKQPRDW